MGILEYLEKSKKGKSMKPGGGGRFAKMVGKLKGKVRNPKAVAAAIGRKKYGKKKMAKFSAQGRKRAAKSLGIVEFIKSRVRKVKALKTAGHIRRAGITSSTYRHTAPATKRSVRAKLRMPPKRKLPKKAKIKALKSYRNDDVRYPHGQTAFDREAEEYDESDDHGMDESHSIEHSPYEPERDRGRYRKKKYYIEDEA